MKLSFMNKLDTTQHNLGYSIIIVSCTYVLTRLTTKQIINNEQNFPVTILIVLNDIMCFIPQDICKLIKTPWG